jgi:hypothetical protein
MGGKVSGDAVVERYQGGPYTAMGYSREGGAPGKVFGKG